MVLIGLTIRLKTYRNKLLLFLLSHIIIPTYHYKNIDIAVFCRFTYLIMS